MKITSMEALCEEGRVAGHALRYLPETDSTNRVALEQARKGGATGLVVVADHQTEGRGRLGKSWHSTAGTGLYFSILLRPALDLEDLAKITLVAGVAVAEALQPLCGEKVMLKWPNDIVIGGKKCGGILAESELSADDSPAVVLGLGLNLQRPQGGYPADIIHRAGALADFASSELEAGSLLTRLVEGMDRLLLELEQGRWQEIRERWQLRDITQGKRLEWLTAGGKRICGISLGIDAEGLLFIRDDEGVLHEVLSGDVQLQVQ